MRIVWMSLLLASACTKDWSDVDLERTECVFSGHRVEISAPRLRFVQSPEGCLWNEDISGEDFAAIAVKTAGARTLDYDGRWMDPGAHVTRREALPDGGFLVAWHDGDYPTHLVELARPTSDPDVQMNCEAVVATRKKPADALAWLIRICESMNVLPATK